jgi:phosphoglycolate phosphatase
MTVEFVIFDLDGTLIDSIGDLGDSMNVTLTRLGLPTHIRDDYRRFIGNGMATFVRRSLPSGSDSGDTFDTALALMVEEYSRRRVKTTRPFDGVPELLAELAERGLMTAVLSNKPDAATREIVDHLFADHPFAAVVGGLADVPLKPDPTSCLAICREAGVSPAATALVGDSEIDAQTAARAEVLGVGVTWGFRTADEFHDTAFEHLIHHPRDLLEILL